MSGGNPIADILHAELATLSEFLAVLRDEQSILQANEPDRLIPLLDLKSILANRLGELLARRESLLTAVGAGSGRTGMENWLNAAPAASDLRQQWQSLLSLTQEARGVHETNGKLIALHMQHNQQALSALLSAAGRPLTYGPDGQQRIGTGTGRTLGSA